MEPSTQQKYAEERNKRYHPAGLKQYIVDLTASESFRHFQDDPWEPLTSGAVAEPVLKDGDSCKFLILGAGYGGLLFAVNLIQAGVDVKDIRLVDVARGFGGVWYWNRYPGLQCDVESYVYMPLLEETGYVPKHKYSSGNELREQAERIASMYDLKDKALFSTRVDSLTWNDQTNEWMANLHQAGDGETTGTSLSVKAKFVLAAYGVGNFPKLPDLPGLDQFQGAAFHTSRWSYDVTGGSPDQPDLVGLSGKKVGIVGTGATAIQAIPYLARWSKELFVFQRTPSAVGPRNNKPTNQDDWMREVATKPGWQLERAENFNAFLTNAHPKPQVNMVDDEWTKLPSYSALIGSPVDVTRDTVASYVNTLENLDLPRQESIRARIDEIVKNRATAAALKPWYPSWCKRPCFNDDYLDTFNRPNVTLVDTHGKGVEQVGPHSVTANGVQYDVDVLIFATGYRPPTLGSPAARCRMKVYGRHGRCMDEKWESGVSTLHGIISRDFPNFFFPGPFQAGQAANGSYNINRTGKHIGHIITAAMAKVGHGKAEGHIPDLVIEPTAEAEEAWATLTASHALNLSAMVSCTPNYMVAPENPAELLNVAEERKKKARGALWGKGSADYETVLKAWKDEGSLAGLDILDCSLAVEG